MSRSLALVICLSACVGIGLEFGTLIKEGASIAGAAWTLSGYFTILTNALVAAVFAALAINGKHFDHPRLMAGVVSAIVLVGVIFTLLLQGLRTLAGASAEANFLLHQLNPILAALSWFLFTRKGALSWRDPLLWALYPVAYLVYALARGAAEGHYAYPFIDVSAVGWARVAANSVVIALCFVAAGEGLVWIDRTLARRR
ncbi:Pr6Pr family membrane protein [Mesorhizobium sp. B292B1B]|uniref:Pr6Pr family membrane protein n=1 Tax=unclassified Mesorhizobium TaxID=325217 RepID=UPI001AEEBC4A|nr:MULTISPECIES: Pr6Pr family membrane protein [unclassified Mesorhizobium]MCA0013826.1 Pr6Pr family membrane protein [Mesorhizobium sp. B294B1A1]MCA0040521.1 Pr6Pr family membrane protein [Mesorhizobium sp. B292B1B]